jgi:MFS family permease
MHYYIYAGWFLCLAALLSSAFANDVNTLLATQGVLLGVGMLALEMPTFIILNSWFIKRRGLAYGVLFGLTDLFGVGWGFLANALLMRYGMRTTFFAFTAICFAAPAVAMPFLRERQVLVDDDTSDTSVLDPLSCAGARTTAHAVDRSHFLRAPVFYILLSSSLLQSFAYYLPYIYLPSYTSSLGHSLSTGTIVLALANIGQLVGEVLFGRLSDKARAPTLAFISAAGTSLSAFLLWSFATNLATLIPFAILYGAFGAGFMALWPRMGTMFGEDNATTIYSILSFGRGVAVIASGPISTGLLGNPRGLMNLPLNMVQQTYRPVVLFVGACMAASAILGALARVWPQKEGERPPVCEATGTKTSV